MADEEEGKRQQGPKIVLEREMMPGVWANFARVSHSRHEFTIDFVRLEPDGKQGIVVSRVSVSPLFVTQLIDALTANWERYADKALPKEFREQVEGGGPQEGEGGGESDPGAADED